MESKHKLIIKVDPLIQPLVPEYLENRKKEIPRLISALEKSDFVEIRSIGHNLKGTGSGFGFHELTAIGKELESAAYDRNKAKVEYLTEQMKNYLERIEVRYEE